MTNVAPLDLSEMGITEDDMQSVQAIRTTLENANKHDIVTYGSDAATSAASCADELLSKVDSKDISLAHKQIADVASLANSINLSGLSQQAVMVPLIGDISRFPLFKRFNRFLGKAQHQITAQFVSAKEQIDCIIAELEATQDKLRQRNTQYEELYKNVNTEYHKLGQYIAAASLHVKDLKSQHQKLRLESLSDIDAHKVQDMNQTITDWEKRIANLSVLQQNALQTLPSIRILQQNNISLVEKYDAVSSLTIPLWKRQFTLHLGLNEQKNAVELANRIDDTTNRLLKDSADLLHTNSVQTAKANKRLAIDVDTLQYVQEKLLLTLKETNETNGKALSEYGDATLRIREMRDAFKTQLLEAKHNQIH
jgi:uncharacterized protein YaaN involved in tellurite resistance